MTTTQASPEIIAERVQSARKTITGAQRKAKRVHADLSVNRTTRARNALKIKADALDQVAGILAGNA